MGAHGSTPDLSRIESDEHRFWSFYASRALELMARATKSGVGLAKLAQMPEAASEYALNAIGEMRRCLDARTPYLRRRALERAAMRFQNRQGWRSEIPYLATNFENALRALTLDQTPGKAGNPARTLGRSRIPERRYVNRAIADLTQLALSQGRSDWAVELLRNGEKANEASQGRKLVFRYALNLAKKDGQTLCAKTLQEQIRIRAKAPPTHLNFLALYADKVAKRKRRQKPALIKAAGT